jgi:serine/threonine protein kinase
MRVAAIAAQILKSLMEAHGLGIVHRDIKPSNVMLVSYSGEDDFVKVLDFGVARPMAKTRGGSITREGQIIGSAPYMAPEQVRAERIDARADIYALGLVLAEALSGKPVYDAPSEIHIWLMHTTPGPAPLSAFARSSALGPIIERAVEKDANKRYASAAEMLDDVERVLASMDQGVPSTDPEPHAVIGPPPSTDRERFANRPTAIAEPPRSTPRATRILVAASVAVVLVALGFLALSPKPPDPAHPTLPPQPAWFSDWERRIAATDWTRTAPPQRTVTDGIDELEIDLHRRTQRAVVRLWSFPREDEARARARAEVASGNAVHVDDVQVASVHVEGDPRAARALLEAIDRPPSSHGP